jgi:hypothetical protein
MNTVEILCTHVCKCKIKPVESVPEIGGGRMKEWWRG